MAPTWAGPGLLQNNNGNNSSGNAPTTVNENAPSTSNNKSNGNAPLPPP